MNEQLTILSLYHGGALSTDDTLYILESLSRADSGLIGARSYRDNGGILRAPFSDGARVYREAQGGE